MRAVAELGEEAVRLPRGTLGLDALAEHERHRPELQQQLGLVAARLEPARRGERFHADGGTVLRVPVRTDRIGARAVELELEDVALLPAAHGFGAVEQRERFGRLPHPHAELRCLPERLRSEGRVRPLEPCRAVQALGQSTAQVAASRVELRLEEGGATVLLLGRRGSQRGGDEVVPHPAPLGMDRRVRLTVGEIEREHGVRGHVAGRELVDEEEPFPRLVELPVALRVDRGVDRGASRARGATAVRLMSGDRRPALRSLGELLERIGEPIFGVRALVESSEDGAAEMFPLDRVVRGRMLADQSAAHELLRIRAERLEHGARHRLAREREGKHSGRRGRERLPPDAGERFPAGFDGALRRPGRLRRSRVRQPGLARSRRRARRRDRPSRSMRRGACRRAA